MGKKSLIIAAVVLLGLGFFFFKDMEKPILQALESGETSAPVISENDPPQIVSTKPDPLDEAIVSATEVLEFRFNRALENEGELKIKTEPENEYKIQLSQDRKVATVTPLKPFELGATYTLTIGRDTKFQGIGAWNQEKMYHFKTIKYRGV